MSATDLDVVDVEARAGAGRRSEVVDDLLLIPGARITDRGETKGWIGAEPLTRRRLSWGLTKVEALQGAREAPGGRPWLTHASR